MLVADVGAGMRFRERHIPGAMWANRARLDRVFDLAYGTRRVVLYGDDEGRARLAALDVGERVKVPTHVLAGGLEAWVAEGRATAASPDTPSQADCIDHLFWVADRHKGNDQDARDYLAWEHTLAADIARDGLLSFALKPR